MPIVHRRSKPVNGSVLDFASLPVDGVVALAGSSLLVGVLVSFDGEVPVLGVVGVVGVEP